MIPRSISAILFHAREGAACEPVASSLAAWLGWGFASIGPDSVFQHIRSFNEKSVPKVAQKTDYSPTI